MNEELKWRWKMDYCKGRGIPPAQEWAWAEAEQAYLAKLEEAPQNTKEGANLLHTTGQLCQPCPGGWRKE